MNACLLRTRFNCKLKLEAAVGSVFLLIAQELVPQSPLWKNIRIDYKRKLAPDKT